MTEPIDIRTVDPHSVRYELLAYGYTGRNASRRSALRLRNGALDDPPRVKDALELLAPRVQAGAELLEKAATFLGKMLGGRGRK